MYGEEPLEVACREMSNLGIRHLDLWHVKGWCEHLAGGIDRVRRTLAEYGIKLEAISAYSTPLEQLGDIVDAAKELGGTAVVTGSDKPDMSVAEFAEKIAPVAERAARAGVKLAIENHGNAVIDSIESMVELVRLVPEGLGIALAPIHLYRRGERTEDAIRALQGRIALMYIWDWGPTGDVNWKDPAEQFVGTGKIDFPPIFRALVETGYTRPLDLFAHGPEYWPAEKTSAHLRKALETARAFEAAARASTP